MSARSGPESPSRSPRVPPRPPASWRPSVLSPPGPPPRPRAGWTTSGQRTGTPLRRRRSSLLPRRRLVQGTGWTTSVERRLYRRKFRIAWLGRVGPSPRPSCGRGRSPLQISLRVEVEELGGASGPSGDREVDAIGLVDDGAVAVGPIDAGSGRLEPGQRLRGRMAERVACASGDDRERRPRRFEEGRARREAAPMMGDSERENAHGPSSRQDAGLALPAEVPGEQHRDCAPVEPQDEGVIVRAGARLTVRIHHRDEGIAYPEPLSGAQDPTRRARLLQGQKRFRASRPPPSALPELADPKVA